MYSWSTVIPILGMGFATLGAVMLAELARQDFREREQWRRARGVVWGAALLAIGFFLVAGCYAWQSGRWHELLGLLASMCVGALIGFFTGRSRRS